MAILAIDSCLDQCAVALRTPEGETFSRIESRAKGHAERLGPMVMEIFNKSGMTAKNLHKINVTTGPGSFTGVRVGLSFARGMAIGQAVKLHGMTSFAALALSAGKAENPNGKIITLIDARRGQIYGQIFNRDDTGEAIPDGAPFVEDPSIVTQKLRPFRQIDGTTWLGSGVALVAPDLTSADTLPDPVLMTLWAARNEAFGAPTPTYLRPPDAKPRRQNKTVGRS